ncbi:flagellar basal body P-ring biosynthesis protein FlgA [Planctomycetes bacterium MalM25]|nr:flagellar basal body P-ring biosynthesis protein FlgA [Planctomycetes bacterium MalM25]
MPRPFALLLIALASPLAGAAEIALRENATAAGGALVRLGDVATVTGGDAARLERLPLSPSPTPGERQFVSAGSIRAMLAAQGEDPRRHRFTGAYRVRVQTPLSETPQTAPEPDRRRLAASPRGGDRMAFRVRTSAAAVESTYPTQRVGVRAKQTVEGNLAAALQAEIDRRLDGQGERPTRLAVRSVKLSATALRELAQLGEMPLTVAFRPSDELSAGQLTARVWPESRLGDEAFRVVADLVEQPMRAVAATPIGRGEMITTSAVRMEPVPLKELEQSRAYGYATAERAIGRETKRSVRPGEVLSDANTAPPLMVRRGEEVEVVSGGGGVMVSLLAIASQDGRQGDLIAVERFDSKDKLTARVVGPRRLAVLSAGSALSNVVRTGGLR